MFFFMLGQFLSLNFGFFTNLIFISLDWVFMLIAFYKIDFPKAKIFPRFIFFMAFLYAFVEIVGFVGFPLWVMKYPFLYFAFYFTLFFFLKDTKYAKYIRAINIIMFFVMGAIIKLGSF